MHWLLGQPFLMNAWRRAVLPVFRERLQLADAPGRQLQALGRKRRQPKPADLGRVPRAIPSAHRQRAQRRAGAASQAGDRMTVVRRADRLRLAMERHEWVRGRLAVLEVAGISVAADSTKVVTGTPSPPDLQRPRAASRAQRPALSQTPCPNPIDGDSVTVSRGFADGLGQHSVPTGSRLGISHRLTRRRVPRRGSPRFTAGQRQSPRL